MNSNNPIQISTAPLIGVAAVWQGWKLILSSVVAGTVGISVLLLLGLLGAGVSQTPAFNARTRAWAQQYEACEDQWIIEGRRGDHHHMCKAFANRAVAAQFPQ